MGYRTVITGIVVAFALLELVFGRLINKETTTKKDMIIEIASGVLLPLLVVPGIFTAVPVLVESIAPGHANALAHWPAVVMFGVLLVADDLTQYLWHRASHAVPALYRLHRAHHSAEYMSVRIVYRNNLFYYAMMPGLWLSAGLVHLGFAPVYYVYIIAKMAAIIGAHSSVGWDSVLARYRIFHPSLWLLERVISTPMTHAAHHGRHADDGVTHYRGNFGNFLFLWDVIFKTAKITRRRPVTFGLENVEPATWAEELVWPLAASRNRALTRSPIPARSASSS